MSVAADDRTSLYLKGDPGPALVALNATTILHMLRETAELAATVEASDLVFCPLPLRNGDTGYFRPSAIAALIPRWPGDDDEDDEDD